MERVHVSGWGMGAVEVSLYQVWNWVMGDEGSRSERWSSDLVNWPASLVGVGVEGGPVGATGGVSCRWMGLMRGGG